jgi:hypothetical protein
MAGTRLWRLQEVMMTTMLATEGSDRAYSQSDARSGKRLRVYVTTYRCHGVNTRTHIYSLNTHTSAHSPVQVPIHVTRPTKTLTPKGTFTGVGFPTALPLPSFTDNVVGGRTLPPRADEQFALPSST